MSAPCLLRLSGRINVRVPVIRPTKIGSYLPADLRDGTSRSGEEMRMIASFIAFQQATEWHMRKPTLTPQWECRRWLKTTFRHRRNPIASRPQEIWMGVLFRRNFFGKLSQIPPAAQFSGEHSGRNCIYQTGLI